MEDIVNSETLSRAYTAVSTNWSSVGSDYKAEGARGILHLQPDSWVGA